MEGNSYIGLNTFTKSFPDHRDYVEIELNTILLSGKKYCIEFYVSLADSVQYACSDIGAFFSPTEIGYTSQRPLPYIPQVSNISNFLTDKTEWMKVSGSFMAQGGEKFLVISNFKGDINTDTVYVGGAPNGQYNWAFSYYYIDDVSVTLCDSVVGVKEYEGEQTRLRVSPNPARTSFTLHYGLPAGAGKATAEVYDVTGRRVAVYNLPVNSGSITLEVSGYNPGLYYVKLLVNGLPMDGVKMVVAR